MKTIENKHIFITDRQCCVSRMFIPDPDFYPSRIPDPKTATKERDEKKFIFIPLLLATNFTKFKITFFEILVKKKIWANFQKLSLSSQKFGFGIRDPGSEIRDPEKTYSGSRIQGSKRHRFPDPDPQHC
jgi:hypothetical protein